MDETTRTCGFCCTRRPLAELGQAEGSGGFRCLDFEACRARAQDAMIYPLTDSDAIEQALAVRDATAGAVARS
jgi:hypothetical protein